jgi:ubiquinone/menaquinone biosynthesis C-methylase UbiE
MSQSENFGPEAVSLKGANYGIDAPDVVKRFFLIGLAGLALGLGSIFVPQNEGLLWVRFFVQPCFTMGILFFLQALVMMWGSKYGKLKMRDRVIADIAWSGEEKVLDVGCGHGLMLIAAAKRLNSGKVIGVDLWQPEDQAGNSRDATWRNVEVENVADRVELRYGDARQLPFEDKTFDVILSSWALHNIYDEAGRATALREIVRVLKPGGRVVIVDIRHTAEYARVLREAGMAAVRRGSPNFLFVIPSFKLTAMKI